MKGIRFALRVLTLLIAAAVAHSQWTQFRGPNGSGVDSAAGYPAEFSSSKNVAWKTALPHGQSSPVVAGGHVYLTATENNKLVTICLNARTGRELWRPEVPRPRSPKIYSANDPASPTPAADESGVIVFFPDFGLAAYTPEGMERWTLPLGPFKNFYGMAASPIVVGDLLVLVCDQQSGSYMLAVDRKTGRQRWKTERVGATVGWASPIVFRPTTGAAQLIVLGTTRLDSYDLDTGKSRWWMPLASMGGLGTPVASGDTIFVSTLAANEPWMPTFEATLQTYDKDKDGRLSQPEFAADKENGRALWLDRRQQR